MQTGASHINYTACRRSAVNRCFDLCLLLACCQSFRFGSLLLIAPNHDHTEEAPDNCRTKDDQDDRKANRPYSRWEEIVKRVAWVNKWL